MNEIPWDELQQESKKFLTKNNKINYRIPEASREVFVEKIRTYIPWVESLSTALWCISGRKIGMPSEAQKEVTKRIHRDWIKSYVSKR